MAELRFELTDIDDRIVDIDNILSYELSMDVDAPCHGLRLYFTHSRSLAELYSIRVYTDSKCIFNGYVDTQRETVNDDGITCFVYARSSACLLVDNQAKPFTYCRPCTEALYFLNAKEYGFTNQLPNIACDGNYLVTAGKSCWAAINDFVYGMTGSRIFVTADNCIVPARQGKKSEISPNSIVSARRVINRGDVISGIDYKNGDSSDYINHYRSDFFCDRRIRSTRKQNLGAYPEWQKNYILHNQLAQAGDNYIVYQLRLADVWQGNLLDTVELQLDYFGGTGVLQVSSIRYSMDKSGVSTVVKLRRTIDMEEINYVAE
ncbi:MAG: hypothetical protein ACI4IN_02970 [Eubacterium sp.]